MAQRAIREFHTKKMFSRFLAHYSKEGIFYDGNVVLVRFSDDVDLSVSENPWLVNSSLVVKPDQLIGKRGKSNLLLLNASLSEVKEFIRTYSDRDVEIGGVKGKLTHFMIEPFFPHDEVDEYYLAFRSERECDVVLFSLTGGIDIEDNWEKVISVSLPLFMSDIERAQVIEESLLPDFSGVSRRRFTTFVSLAYQFYVEYGFTFLEMNPLLRTDDGFIPLDCKARVDDTACFEQGSRWAGLEFPSPFGQFFSPEEKKIRELDEKSGSSLKLTLLNPKGRIWMLIAGGGASVVYADTVVDLGAAKELANYGEYSGDPKTDEVYEYTKTLLDLMTREHDERGKVLLIGGGIANFTDVAKTFTGIISALTDYRDLLIARKVKIYVRRGGPNYQEGLKKMRQLGEDLGLPIEVFGPETHMTAIVRMGLGL